MSEEIMTPETGSELLVATQTDNAVSNVWNNKDQFNQMLRAAQMLSQTSIIPATYQNKPQDCFVAIEMATRMGLSPMVVMQNMYVVKGKPSWSGSACTMLINSCGKYCNVKHIYTGTKGTEDRGCYVQATRISDGEQVRGVEVTIQMAKAEGWLSNPKWRSMPELMLAYRASSFFARVYCPESLMGVHTDDEIYDAEPYGKAPASASDLTNELNGDGLLQV